MDGAGLDFTVIWTNITYFFIGRFPHGPLGGIALTLYLAVVACVLSFFGGLILGMLNISHNRVVKWVSLGIVNIIRGMPLLMVIFWMYFLLPAMMGRTVTESWTVIMALTTFYVGLYVTDREGRYRQHTDRTDRSRSFHGTSPLAGNDLHYTPPGTAQHDPLLRKPVCFHDQRHIARLYRRSFGADPRGDTDQ